MRKLEKGGIEEIEEEERKKRKRNVGMRRI
jgi:hypothetical protein